MLAVALPTIVAVSFHLRRATPIPPLAIGRPGSSRPRSPAEKAPNSPRQKTGSVQIPITPDAHPAKSYAVSLYGAFFVKKFARGGKSLVLRCSISKPVSSSRPRALTSSRAGAIKVGRRPNVAACSELTRPYLDSFEHDDTLVSIGMTIRGGARLRTRDQSRHNLVSGGSKDPNHDAVIRIGSEAPKRRTHSPFRH